MWEIWSQILRSQKDTTAGIKQNRKDWESVNQRKKIMWCEGTYNGEEQFSSPWTEYKIQTSLKSDTFCVYFLELQGVELLINFSKEHWKNVNTLYNSRLTDLHGHELACQITSQLCNMMMLTCLYTLVKPSPIFLYGAHHTRPLWDLMSLLSKSRTQMCNKTDYCWSYSCLRRQDFRNSICWEAKDAFVITKLLCQPWCY